MPCWMPQRARHRRHRSNCGSKSMAGASAKEDRRQVPQVCRGRHIRTDKLDRARSGAYHRGTSSPRTTPSSMSLRRRNRLFTVLIALLSLLSMQFALAAYVCPGAVSKVAVLTQMAQTAMPCEETMAGAMDGLQPGLCHAHCQAEHQSADKYQAPAAALPIHSGTGFITLRLIPVPPGAPLQAPLLTRTTAPPVTVRHCCFRI